MADGKLKLAPRNNPVNAGCIPNSIFGIKKPIINRSMKAALIASFLLRLFSYLSGIITKTSIIPKTKPHIVPKIILFILFLYFSKFDLFLQNDKQKSGNYRHDASKDKWRANAN
ncbi:hypothetical protein COX22_01885, partial [Candidatus Falkowbacteria bacterium CG23_combo_of_CG06-09_8_20_14_all_49_15]